MIFSLNQFNSQAIIKIHEVNYQVKGCSISFYSKKLKNTKYYTVGTVPKSNRKKVERSNLDIPYTQIKKI